MGTIIKGSPTKATNDHCQSFENITKDKATSETKSRPKERRTLVAADCSVWLSPRTRSINSPGGWRVKTAPSSVKRCSTRRVCNAVVTFRPSADIMTRCTKPATARNRNKNPMTVTTFQSPSKDCAAKSSSKRGRTIHANAPSAAPSRLIKISANVRAGQYLRTCSRHRRITSRDERRSTPFGAVACESDAGLGSDMRLQICEKLRILLKNA